MQRYPDADAATPPAKSAARLAAESAFADPAVAAPQVHPVPIVVRKARTALFAAPPLVAGADDTAGASGTIGAVGATPAKRARVFLVGAAPATAPTLADAVPAAPPLSRAAPGAKGQATPHAKPANRPRRSADADKRPGPLVQVMAAPPAQARPAALPPLHSSDLAAALAPVAPVLELIARAQAFTLADADMDGEWLRLQLRLRACQAALRSSLG